MASPMAATCHCCRIWRRILTSSDGASWTVRNSGTRNTINAATYNGVQFIAVGDNGTFLTSSDGTTWTINVMCSNSNN